MRFVTGGNRRPELKWHYHCTPGDQWDYDAISHLMLANLRINGRKRKVIMQASKNALRDRSRIR